MDSFRIALSASVRCTKSQGILSILNRSFCTSRVRVQNSRPWANPTRRKTSSFQSRSYVLLIVPIATFGLGTWQVQRRKWKLDLIKQLEALTLMAPVTLPEDLDAVSELQYRKVSVRGTFDHSQEVYIAPRPPVGDDSHGSGHGGGLISGAPSKSGAYVVTAFNLADRNMRIMVNRGWVPRNRIKPETRLRGQIEGEIEIVGVVRESEKRPPFGAKNDPLHNQWHFRDQESIARVLNTEPILIDAVAATTVTDGPLGGQTRVTLRNEHLSYIFTWYSLSAITFAGWYLRYWKVG